MPVIFEDTEASPYRAQPSNLCCFFLHYKRRDPDDIESEYVLERYNMYHNHPLDYKHILQLRGLRNLQNIYLNRIKDGKSYSDASKKVNFFLKKDDTIKFAVINGFLIDIEKQKLPRGFNAKIE